MFHVVCLATSGRRDSLERATLLPEDFKNMYAVIETGGKQYRVAPGQTIEVDTIAGDIGAPVEFDRVLVVSNETQGLLTGESIASARVRGKIAGHGRGDKVIVFKFKRKKQYKLNIGHRQNYTRVQVEEILA